MRRLVVLGAALGMACSSDATPPPATYERPSIIVSERECGGRRSLIRGEIAVLLAECVAFESECTLSDLPPKNQCCVEDGNATEEENRAFQALCEAGVFTPVPDADGSWRAQNGVTSAEFAVVVCHVFGLEPVGKSETWYGAWYRALQKAGLLPPHESDNPACPPSEEFVQRVLSFCKL